MNGNEIIKINGKNSINTFSVHKTKNDIAKIHPKISTDILPIFHLVF